MPAIKATRSGVKDARTVSVWEYGRLLEVVEIESRRSLLPTGSQTKTTGHGVDYDDKRYPTHDTLMLFEETFFRA